MERGFVYACVVQFLLGLSWTMINILLVIYAGSFEAPSLLGILWSIIGVSRLLAETPGGILVDRMGSRVVVLSGLAGVTVSYIQYARALTSTDVLVASALAGAGFSVTHIGLLVQATDLTPPGERARYMGILNGSMMAPNILGPLIGGLIAEHFQVRAVFIASTLTAAVALVISIFTVRDAKKTRGQFEGTASTVLQDYLAFIKNKVYLVLFLVSFCSALVVWSLGAIVFPTYGRSVLSLTIAEIGLLISLHSVVLFLNQFFLSGIMEKHVSRRRLVALGLTIYGAAACTITILSDFISLAAAFIVLGIGLGTINPSLEAIWIDITRPEDRGRVFGLRIAFFDFGQVFFSAVLPLLMILNPRLPFYAIALGAISSVVLLHLTVQKPQTGGRMDRESHQR